MASAPHGPRRLADRGVRRGAARRPAGARAFDPAIHLYSEDMDVGLRAARAGIPSYFCPDVCRVIHRGGASASIAFPAGASWLAAANRRAVVRRA